MKRASQQGIALVITLILLSVITFMAVTFLVVSRHEGEQVDTLGQMNISKAAAQGMEQQAEAQLISGMLGMTNGLGFGLAVSTTFYNTGGYNPDPTVRSNLNNVSYNYIPASGGGPLSQADQMQMLNNMLYLPRAPVFITTNKNQTTPEFRFYLDLNGNGVYDTNGLVTETALNNSQVQNSYTGDPEWIGFLEHPELRHSSSNFFLSRGAFIAVPIGNSLDINYIHNQAKFLDGLSPGTSADEGFFRNEGVGPWEINLAAFLQTLNTSIWGPQQSSYFYSTNTSTASQGLAFTDAASIMQYRYNGSYQGLNAFANLYGNSAYNSYLLNAAIDAYATGPLMTGVNPSSVMFDSGAGYATGPWSGADNPTLFVRPRDLLTAVPAYISSQPLVSFTNHLYQAGVMFDPNPPAPPPAPSITNSYNRYTFYRALAQLGVGSAPEPAPYPVGGGSQLVYSGQLVPLPIPAGTNIWGRNQMSYGTIPEAFPYVHGRKMNLNYNNINFSATNFVPWTAAQFFTNAADRLLRLYFPTNIAIMVNGTLVVTNININFIPIYPVNNYTPAVHRALQLAANMYDATMNKSTNAAPNNFDYPSVFRPIFNKVGLGASSFVSISGYYEVSNDVSRYISQPLDPGRTNGGVYEVDSLKNQDGRGNDFTDNIYGVPYVIGARRGLPNFNQFSMAPVVQVTRMLQLVHSGLGYTTNAAYQIGISNVMGVQCWNSYTNYYGYPGVFARSVNICATNDFSILITNNFGAAPTPYIPTVPVGLSNSVLSWPQGYTQIGLATNSFQLPLSTNIVVLGNVFTTLNPPGYTISTNAGQQWNKITQSRTTGGYFVPDWGILITNRLRVILTDAASGRIIDYVQLGGLGQLPGLNSQDDVGTNLYNANYPSTALNIWDPTITSNGAPAGFFHQWEISSEAFNGAPLVNSTYWASAVTGTPGTNTILTGIAGLNSWLINVTAPPQQMPYSPTVSYAKVYTWSANDPLVHYMVGDLTDPSAPNGLGPYVLSIITPTNVLNKLNGQVAPRYRPWVNLAGLNGALQALTNNHVAYADPWITQSADWQFLTNKYPSIGWLGRVHRGTPWQTVYLKSTNVIASVWQNWTGNTNVSPSNPALSDSTLTQPINDWQMLDLFTTEPNDNAGRGQLSVNQTNAAAWAAVLDGVMVLANNIAPNKLIATNIDTSNPVGQGQFMISAINGYRALLTGQSNVFTGTGQVFGTPQLTVNSPYITANDGDPNLTDAVYERIPQQIASLLRTGTPRYAIYAYGQALKPADKSIVQSGSFIGMCTNYQITGEMLTRTIVRFDNPPVPGEPLPGTTNIYALPVQGLNYYVMVTNVVPPMRAVVESYSVLGPDE